MTAFDNVQQMTVDGVYSAFMNPVMGSGGNGKILYSLDKMFSLYPESALSLATKTFRVYTDVVAADPTAALFLARGAAQKVEEIA